MDRALPARGAPGAPRARASPTRSSSPRAARPMTRQAFWAPGQAPRARGGHPQRDLAAHAAPRVRHAPHQSRRRPARRAAAARPRRHLDHADLHPRRARAPEGRCTQAPPARMNRHPARLAVAVARGARSWSSSAYTVFGLSGFGSTVISVPILAHFLPVSYLVPLMALLDLVVGDLHRHAGPRARLEAGAEAASSRSCSWASWSASRCSRACRTSTCARRSASSPSRSGPTASSIRPCTGRSPGSGRFPRASSAARSPRCSAQAPRSVRRTCRA